MSKDLIGTDDWMCDGYALTPEMRHDILTTVADAYEAWKPECIYRSSPLVTVMDFVLAPSWEPIIYECLGERISERFEKYLVEHWGEGIYDDEDKDGDFDPIVNACCRLDEWFNELNLEDVEKWRAQSASGTNEPSDLDECDDMGKEAHHEAI